MAYVMCRKHGGHGAAAVCQHILDAVIAGDRLAHMANLIVEYEGHRLGPIWFCTACASRYGIPPEGLLLTGDDGIDQMFAWGWSPVCPMCFREAGGEGFIPFDSSPE
jgi:hypothetical protein